MDVRCFLFILSYFVYLISPRAQGQQLHKSLLVRCVDIMNFSFPSSPSPSSFGCSYAQFPPPPLPYSTEDWWHWWQKKTLRGWKMYARGSLASYFGENIPPLNQICFSSPQQFKFIVKSVFFKLYFLPIAIVLRILKKLLYSSHQEDLMLSLIVPKSAHFRISCFSVPHSSFYWSKRSHQYLQEVTEEENLKMLRDDSINIIILQHNP